MKEDIQSLIDEELEKTPYTLEDVYSNVKEEIDKQVEDANLWAQRQQEFEKDKEELEKIKEKYSMTGEELLKKQEEAMKEAMKYLNPEQVKVIEEQVASSTQKMQNGE